MNNTILRYVGLTDPNFKFIVNSDNEYNRYEHRGKDHHKALITRATLESDIMRCPDCGYLEHVTKYGYTDDIEIYLPTTNGYDNRLIVKKQRFHCDSCNTKFNAKSHDLLDNSKFSRPLMNQIIAMSQDDISQKSIARSLRVSTSSVHRIINSDQTYYYDFQRQLPSVLCFDEVRTSAHNMSFVYADGEAHQLIEILPDRLSKNIKEHFLGYSLQNRRQVEYVIIDLNANYGQFVRGLFPNAKIIIDRFHIVQRVAQALTGQRVADQRSIEDKRYSHEYAIMKSQWRLFMKSYDKLNKNTRVYLAGVKELMTEEEALDLVFRSFPTLHATWLTYQSVLEAMHEQNIQKFSDILVGYSPLRNAMDTAISTFSKNLAGVLESLRSPWSNGVIEGINRKIKQISRTAYGYRNQLNFFRRIRTQLVHPRIIPA